MKIQIKNRWTAEVIFETDAANIGEAVVAALKITCSLRGADLRGADLSGADLSGADLRGADLSGQELAIAQTRILPDGDIIGWKKCCNGVLVKLKIPAAAKRSHAFGRKCRAEFAEVLEVIGATIGQSQNDSSFTYEVGKTVEPTEPFCEEWKEECASGIHFFITRIEAENY